jgi:hypothetical protein
MAERLICETLYVFLKSDMSHICRSALSGALKAACGRLYYGVIDLQPIKANPVAMPEIVHPALLASQQCDRQRG